MDFIQTVFNDAGSDKASSHAYHNVYPYILEYVDALRAGYDHSPLHIMELGYETGAGMYGLTRLMPHFSFVSLDITFDKDKYPQLMKPRVEKIQCDCGNREAVRGVAKYLADIKFGLIVDDASHLFEHQKLCLEELWHLLVPGGVYLIEDIFTLEQAYRFSDYPGFVVMDTRPVGQTNDLTTVMRKPFDTKVLQ